MKKTIFLFIFLWGNITYLFAQSLPTPTGIAVSIEPNNRFKLTWSCNISHLFSVTNTAEAAWFEIEIDNGISKTISRTPDLIVANPSNTYEYQSPFYLKPSTQYYVRVRIHYRETFYSVPVTSNWSTISNPIMSSAPPEYGITVLTHGFQLMGKLGINSDFEKHARKIYNRLAGEATVLINDGATGIWKIMRAPNGNLLGTGDRNKELVFLYDWASASNGTGTMGESGELEAAADRLFAMLTEVKVMNPTTGLVEIWYTNAAMMAKKNHFIGHSRGVGMLLQVFHRFGKYHSNVTIDHFTSLDAHPAAKYGDVLFNESGKPALVESVKPLASLPGVYELSLPSNCYTPIEWSSAFTQGWLGKAKVATQIIQNEVINPLCKNADIELRLPTNVIRAENYYRVDGSYEETHWIDENLIQGKKIIDDILAIYDVTSIDPNPGKQRTGYDASQISSIRVGLERDLKTLKTVGNYDLNHVIWGGLTMAERNRLRGLWDKLSALKGGVDGAISLLNTDIPTIVDNIINLEVDRVLKVAQFDGIPIKGLNNTWNVKLDNRAVSSGFSSPDITPFFELNEAIGTLAGGAHSGVHHWYFGTVDPINSRLGNDWYSSASGFPVGKNINNLGFYYSRLGKNLNQISYPTSKISIAEMDSRISQRQAGWAFNPIFNGSFHYGEVSWFDNHYLNSKLIKNEKRFPLYLGKNQPANFTIYHQAEQYKTYFYPKTKLRHQMFLVPQNHNYLKFKVEGPQSASFGITVTMEYQGSNNQVMSVTLANDVIAHVGGTSKIYYMDIPQDVKGRICWLTMNFEYRSSQNYSNPNMANSQDLISGVYIDDFDLSVSTQLPPPQNKLNISTSTYCSTPYSYVPAQIEIDKVWDSRTTHMGNSEGFVNWWSLSRTDGSEAQNKKNFEHYRNDNVTWGEASEAAYLAAKKLGFANFQQICSNEKNQQAQIAKFLFDNAFISSYSLNGKITINDLYKLVFFVILDQGTAYPYKNHNRPNSRVNYLSGTPGYTQTAINTAGLAQDKDGKYFYAWLSDGFKNGDIWGNELVSRMSLSKIVSLAYHFKKNVIAGSSQARIASTSSNIPDINDYKSLGAKFELLDEENDIFPTSEVEGKSEYYTSGQEINFSFPTDTLSDGTKVHFYWAINGVSKGGNLTPLSANLQSVKYKAPMVTERTTFELYIFLGGSNGKSAEMTKEIVVTPSAWNKHLVVGEYYIDTDPGVGNATLVFHNYSKVGIDSSFSISTSGLSVGNHTLNLRVKDNQNKWSTVKTTQFAVADPCNTTQSVLLSGNTSIKSGESAYLKLAFSGQPPFNYALSNGISGTSDEEEVYITVQPQQNTTYTISSSSNICESISKSGSAVVQVYSCNLPSAHVSGVHVIDAGQSVNMDLSFAGTPPFNYELSNGLAGTSNTPTKVVTVSPNVNTTYFIKNVSNACGVGYTSGVLNVLINECPDTINHVGTISANTYKAGQTIQSSANIPTGTIYRAGNSITLLPGFQAGSNETFEAKIGGCQNTNTIPTNGLVAYYPFNAATGFVDESSYNNTGTLYGTQTSISRKSLNDAYQWGGAVSFDARRYEVNNSTQIQFTNAMTISFWYNLSSYTGMDGYGQTTANGYHVAIGKEGDRNGFYIGIINDVTNNKQHINFTNKNTYYDVANFDFVGSPSGTSSANLNKWNHLTFTVFPNSIKMYINGQLINTIAATPDFSGANTGKLIIGTMKALNSTWFPFNGGIDELRLYNRSLSDTEVLSIYNAEK